MADGGNETYNNKNTDDLNVAIKQFRDKDSIFQMQDLTLKIGKRKLFITKHDFIQISEVFAKMFSNDFKENRSGIVDFTGKNYKTFVWFLRVCHPGIQDPFEDSTVHKILPLIDEYLAEDARQRADNYLAETTKQKSDNLTTNDLIHRTIEAETYNLPNYLKVCIHLLSQKLYQHLSSDKDFDNISFYTRYKISIARWKEADKREEDMQDNSYRSKEMW